MSGCAHQYDDDRPFLAPDVAAIVAPGSRPGDLCVWCLEPKPAHDPDDDREDTRLEEPHYGR